VATASGSVAAKRITGPEVDMATRAISSVRTGGTGAGGCVVTPED